MSELAFLLTAKPYPLPPGMIPNVIPEVNETPEGMFACSKCRAVIDLSGFYIRSDGRRYLQCKACC